MMSTDRHTRTTDTREPCYPMTHNTIIDAHCYDCAQIKVPEYATQGIPQGIPQGMPMQSMPTGQRM
jgi:hypothetical protein